MITLGLGESLAMRRLRRHASHVGFEERFDEDTCAMCGRVWMWNTYIYPANEPRRCETCAPDEHWYTAFDRSVAEEFLQQMQTINKERAGDMSDWIHV